MKDKEKIKVYKEHDLKNQATIEGPVFKSRFKSWIRTVAFIVVAIFLPEQVAWAIEYNPAALWSHLNPLSALSSQSSAFSTPNPEVFNKAVAQSVHRFLKPLINKPIAQVQIKP
ncbi:MAG: hypothetical protein ABIH27_02595, partial [Candidatus Omnitrophota bacterium]